MRRLSIPLNQPPGLYHLRLGDFVVTTVNDGIYQADFGVITGLDHRECERMERAAFRVVPPSMTMNAVLLPLGGRSWADRYGMRRHHGPDPWQGRRQSGLDGRRAA